MVPTEDDAFDRMLAASGPPNTRTIELEKYGKRLSVTYERDRPDRDETEVRGMVMPRFVDDSSIDGPPLWSDAYGFRPETGSIHDPVKPFVDYARYAELGEARKRSIDWTEVGKFLLCLAGAIALIGLLLLIAYGIGVA